MPCGGLPVVRGGGAVVRIIEFCIGMMLVLLLMSSLASAAEVRVTWTANTEADLAGYRIYAADSSGGQVYGADKALVTAAKTATEARATIPEKKMFFTMTAFDAAGNESKPSIEIMVNGDGPPVPPVIIRIELIQNLYPGETR